jgi:hypothetical protein
MGTAQQMQTLAWHMQALHYLMMPGLAHAACGAHFTQL